MDSNMDAEDFFKIVNAFPEGEKQESLDFIIEKSGISRKRIKEIAENPKYSKHLDYIERPAPGWSSRIEFYVVLKRTPEKIFENMNN